MNVETRANRNFRDELEKDPQGLAFVIFVDVNMPRGSTRLHLSPSTISSGLRNRIGTG